MLSRFHMVPERNGRTDRQTGGWTDLPYQYRASVCWRAIKTKCCLLTDLTYTHLQNTQQYRKTVYRSELAGRLVTGLNNATRSKARYIK